MKYIILILIIIGNVTTVAVLAILGEPVAAPAGILLLPTLGAILLIAKVRQSERFQQYLDELEAEDTP